MSPPRIYKCSYRGCNNKSTDNMSLFKFPKDLTRAEKWMKACNREDLQPKLHTGLGSYKLCEEHFEDKYIVRGAVRNILVDIAIPTIFSHKIHNEDVVVQDLEIGPSTSRSISSVPKSEASEIVQILSSQISDVMKQNVKIEPSTSTSFTTVAGTPQSKKDVITENAALKTIEISSLQTSDVIVQDVKIKPSSSTSTSTIPGTSSQSTKNVITENAISKTVEISSSQTSGSSCVSTQTPASLSAHSPRKEKLRRKLKYLQKIIKKFAISKEKTREREQTYFSEMCDTILDKPLANIVKTLDIPKDRKPTRRRYNIQYKQFAVSLYFLGAQT